MENGAKSSTGPSVFKKLVRVVARTFYSGCCPPRTKGAVSRRKWDKVDTSGLAVILLDYLTQREWVREERMHEELKIAPKLLLKALRFLEQERILRHESRKEGKRAQVKDMVIRATKGEPQSDGDAPLKPLLQSYWAVDYPSFWDVLRLRFHLMRYGIKADVEDTPSVVGYICPKCTAQYTSHDFALLIDRASSQMLCPECGTKVIEESYNDKETGKLEDRQKRREEMKAMLKKLDAELKPLMDLMNQAKDITPPDCGCLSDWAYEQHARRVKGSVNDTPDVDITFGSEAATTLHASELSQSERETEKHSNVKEIPPWMNGNGNEEKQRPRKRRLETPILPPPADCIVPDIQTPSSASESASPAVHSFKIGAATVQPNKKIIINVGRTMLPIAEEEKEDDDGIEWEPIKVAAPKMRDSMAEDMKIEGVLFDAEAARQADIESDLRSNSGWKIIDSPAYSI